MYHCVKSSNEQVKNKSQKSLISESSNLELIFIPHPKTVEEMIECAGPIECDLLPRLVQVTETAAIAAAYQMGRGNKIFADQVAVASMRRMLNKLDMKGII